MKRSSSALLLVFFACLASLGSLRIAFGQAGGKSYKGTVTLKRTNTDPDNNANESVHFPSVVLTTHDGNSWTNNEQPTTAATVSVSNVNKENPSISIPSREFKADNTGISITIDKAGKTYDLIVGPVTKIPATIKAEGQTIQDFWDIQGESANDIPLPADLSILKGSKTIKDTSGATVVLSWDFKIS